MKIENEKWKFFLVLKYRTTQHQDTWNYINSIQKSSRGEQPNLAPPTLNAFDARDFMTPL